MSGWCNDDDKEKKKGCFMCGEEGHMSRDCPTRGKPTLGELWNRMGRRGLQEAHIAKAVDYELPDTCKKCNKEGHMARDCERPDICRNCGEEGNMSKDCSKPEVCKRREEEDHKVREYTQEEKTRQMTDEEGKIREIYVPKAEVDDGKLFESAITSEINFSKFESIPLKVTGDNPPAAIKSISSTDLRPLLLDNIAKSGYKVLTPVQKLCLPNFMVGHDLISCDETGWGGTANFLFPILHKLMQRLADNHAEEMVQVPQCVGITLTWELAMQIKDEARKLAMGSIMRCVAAYGRTSVGYQLTQLKKGCTVFICTPGRMMDFVEKGKVSFENLKHLVLDEADRILDMGFMPDKGKQQTLMFRTKFPVEIQKSVQAKKTADVIASHLTGEGLQKTDFSSSVGTIPPKCRIRYTSLECFREEALFEFCIDAIPQREQWILGASGEDPVRVRTGGDGLARRGGC